MKFTWSYSRLKSFETCPKRHYHYDIAKDIKDDTDNQRDGLDAHRAYEMRIKRNKPLPMPLAYQEPILARLASLPGENYPEQKLALTEGFQPTGFFAEDVWFRTVIDFCNVSEDHKTAAAVDYKTGKPAPDMTQLELIAATVMHHLPELERVRARLLFMAHNKAERAEFTRQDITRIWNDVLPRVRKLQQAQVEQEYPPKPGGLCVRWCAVVSCPFHGRGTHA